MTNAHISIQLEAVKILRDYSEFSQCVFSYVLGYNSDARGFVDTSLQKAIGRGLQSHANDLSAAGKLTVMLGAYVHEKFRGVFHGKAINLSRKLCEEYDKALESYDVLVLPTIVTKPPKVQDRSQLNFGKSCGESNS